MITEQNPCACAYNIELSFRVVAEFHRFCKVFCSEILLSGVQILHLLRTMLVLEQKLLLPFLILSGKIKTEWGDRHCRAMLAGPGERATWMWYALSIYQN